LGTISGTTKYQMNICTSSGTLRNTSTYIVAGARSHASGVVRNTPNTEPTLKAMTHASTDTSSVHLMPETTQSR
jgi:hypothetical protein